MSWIRAFGSRRRLPRAWRSRRQRERDVYLAMDKLAPSLKRQADENSPGDYHVDEKNHQILLSEIGHEHAERLLDSARVLGFRELPWSVEDVSTAIKQTVKANDFKDCYIRPLIYLDGGGWNLSVDFGKPSLAIAVWLWDNYLGEDALAKGIRPASCLIQRLRVANLPAAAPSDG